MILFILRHRFCETDEVNSVTLYEVYMAQRSLITVIVVEIYQYDWKYKPIKTRDRMY